VKSKYDTFKPPSLPSDYKQKDVLD